MASSQALDQVVITKKKKSACVDKRFRYWFFKGENTFIFHFQSKA